MNISLENKKYKVSIASKGAEIQSFMHIPSNTPIIWNGDESVWKNHAPVLFPFIGRCSGGYYYMEGKRVEFSKNHGFARDVEHTLIESDETHAIFSLKADKETLSKYPYHFELRTEYHLTEKALEWKLKIINRDTKPFRFSIGTHAAFSCKPSDCVIEFEKKTFLTKISCTEDGFLSPLKDGKLLKLPYEGEIGFVSVPENGFGNGLLIENNGSEWVSLNDIKTGRKSFIMTKGFKYIMLWQNTNGEGQFICIEPWHGLPDVINSDHVFENKLGLILIDKDDIFECNQNIWEEYGN